MSSIRKFKFVFAALGFIYGLVVLAVAIAASGAGHGSYVPLGLFSAPLGLFGIVASLATGADSGAVGIVPSLLLLPVLWAVLFGLSVGARSNARKLSFLVGMATHYVSCVPILLVEPFADWNYLPRVWGVAVAGAVAYLLGQGSIWLAFVATLNERQRLPPN